MNHRLTASWKAWHALDQEVQFTSDGMRRVDITLLLESCRKGISDQAEEQGLPF